jgi:hypothetical protein
MAVGRDVAISFMANPRYSAGITLVIGESTTTAEILFDPATVETLRDKVDEAVRAWREAVAKQKAETAGKCEALE